MNAIETRISDQTLGIWRVELPDGNWLAHLFHYDGPKRRGLRRPRSSWGGADVRYGASLPRHIELAYRFRWYKNDKDERPWALWLMRPCTSEEDAVEKARDLHDRLMALGLSGWELLRRGRKPADFGVALHKMPGMSSTGGPEMSQLIERPDGKWH